MRGRSQNCVRDKASKQRNLLRSKGDVGKRVIRPCLSFGSSSYMPHLRKCLEKGIVGQVPDGSEILDSPQAKFLVWSQSRAQGCSKGAHRWGVVRFRQRKGRGTR